MGGSGSGGPRHPSGPPPDPLVAAVAKAEAELNQQKRGQIWLFWMAFAVVLGVSVHVGEFYPQSILAVFPRVLN